MVRSSSVARIHPDQRQAYILLLLGIIALLIAWLLHPDPFRYPLGVLSLGIGMLIAALFNPGRLVIASSLTTAIGIAVFFTFSGQLPGNLVFPVYILALGIGLLIIAFAARRGYVGRGALSPAIIVMGVGIIEVLLARHLTPANFIPFMLSFWLPGLGLLILGIIYLLTSLRSRTVKHESQPTR
ncbi:hypothetical protein [Dictyobacter aurantiacus]|uniref:Uncharacterized protein n=1 Tax=Dictyobacter aurantiacus TaxID=1936993 RepID=A0A401Z8V7_9CHLR|nr:hypothetical protein [Dictyobacter aurantiacus]GCE03263.1 hypothetical protein KDAU_05920 [Dictyobacter aurantiacus]